MRCIYMSNIAVGNIYICYIIMAYSLLVAFIYPGDEGVFLPNRALDGSVLVTIIITIDFPLLIIGRDIVEVIAFDPAASWYPSMGSTSDKIPLPPVLHPTNPEYVDVIAFDPDTAL
jgi:hypothetical protein